MTTPRSATDGLNSEEWAAQKLELITELRHAAGISYAVIEDAIEDLRAEGVTWERIAQALGVTRQTAWQRYSQSARDADPGPDQGSMFPRRPLH